MKSKYFFCPNCGTELEKGKIVWELGEDKCIVLGDFPEHTNCPVCGGVISTEAVIKGEYDEEKNGGCLIALIIAIILYFLFTP